MPARGPNLLEEHQAEGGQVRRPEILATRGASDAQRERVREEIEADRQRRLETQKQIRPDPAALDQIRAEVASCAAAPRMTGKVLDRDDHRKLIEDAIGDLDFSVLERESV